MHDAPTKQDRIRAVLTEALAPYKFLPPARAILRETPEYQEARELGVAKRWLEEEADSLCQLLAEATRARLTDLEPPSGFTR